jgi:hypothetical protein
MRQPSSDRSRILPDIHHRTFRENPHLLEGGIKGVKKYSAPAFLGRFVELECSLNVEVGGK